jgi:hypothetical protein
MSCSGEADMSPMTIIDNAYVTLWFHPEKKIVHHQIHKFLYGDALREALNTGTGLLAEHKADKWLSDDRKNWALPPEDIEWSKTDWFPRTVKAGWKYWALVQPEKVVGQMNMKRFTEEYAQQGIIVQVFTDPDAALAWLESL